METVDRGVSEQSSLPPRLKILHILDHSVPLHSGYTFRSQSILREQRRNGWQAIALTSPKHEQSRKIAPEPCEEVNGFRYYRSGGVRQQIPLVSEMKLMNRLYRRICEVASLEHPDILHAHSPILNGIPALWAGRRLRIPVVYEIRAFWEDAAVDHGTYSHNSWKYRLVRLAETSVCHHASQIGILCEGLKQDLIQRGIPEGKITVVSNGIDPEEFADGEADVEYQQEWDLNGKEVVGFLGSFYRYEGLDLLVDAFAQIADRRKNARLLLVGGGETEAELRDQIQNLGLQDRVILPGRIPHERICDVYALCDVLAYPRNSARITELVTPLKPLEAMAAGKALVASNIGGHRELIQPGQTGILFPPRDRQALARSIEELLNDRQLRQTLGEHARRWVHREHSWAKTTAVYEHIYHTALVDRLRYPDVMK